MDYLYTHSNSKIRFYKSDMQLHIESYAAYLVSPGAKRRAAGYLYMGDKLVGEIPHSKLSGPIYIECILLKHVVKSVVEAETGSVFYNCKTTIGIKNMLQILGHQQYTIPIKTDNSTSASYSNSILKEKCSKT